MKFIFKMMSPNKAFARVGGHEAPEHGLRKNAPDGMLIDNYFVTLVFTGFIPPDIHRTRLRLILILTTQNLRSFEGSDHARRTSCHVGSTHQDSTRNQLHEEKGERLSINYAQMNIPVYLIVYNKELMLE